MSQMSPERSFGARRILVTGGAGFVGSAVTRRLVDAGARVTVLDDLFTAAEEIPTGAEFVRGLGHRRALVKELVAEHGLIFHLAARNIIASTANPRDDYATNIGGTLNVLLAARANPRSTGSSTRRQPRSTAIRAASRSTRTTARGRSRPYAVSKLGGENYCTAFAESYGLRVSTVRYSNVYGPRSAPRQPLLRRRLEVPRRGACRPADHRPWRRRADARLHVRRRRRRRHAAGRGPPARRGRGLQRRHRHRDVGQPPGGIDRRPPGDAIDIQHVDRRDIDNIRRRVVNIEKIRRMLRWTPQFTLERGLVETARWYVASLFAAPPLATSAR